MGRQFTFYMGSDNRHSFCEFLKQEGFLFVISTNFEKTDNIFLDDVENEFIVCLYKKEYGEVDSTQIPDSDFFYINRFNSPVIVFKVPNVDDEKLRMFSGRLWLTSEEFTDKNADRKAIEKDYRKLVRWLKKIFLFRIANFTVLTHLLFVRFMQMTRLLISWQIINTISFHNRPFVAIQSGQQATV